MAPKEKKRYITYRVDTYFRDKLTGSRPRRTRESLSETLVRTWNFVKFFLVCSASLFQALAPWMLSAMEVLAVLLIYFLGTSRSLLIHQSPTRYHFSYKHSVEDIVGLACTRCGLLSIAYALGMKSGHKLYLFASYILVVGCFPYILVKIILFRYTHDAAAAAVIFAITGAFSWVHVFAARRAVDWARRRYHMGLASLGQSWEEAEEAYVMLRKPDLEELTKCSDGDNQDAGEDVPPETLADDDSKFIDIGSVKVHYKEVVPPLCVSGSHSSVGVVLVHGFGGGVFAWRHIMEPLAMQCQCRVIAFDRPAFGLTSRPKVTSELENPYTVSSQAAMLLQLCAALQLQHVVLVAHADGCLVTLKAAALAVSQQSSCCFQFKPPAPVTLRSNSGSSRTAQTELLCKTEPASTQSTPRFVTAQAIPALREGNDLGSPRRSTTDVSDSKSAIATPEARPSIELDRQSLSTELSIGLSQLATPGSTHLLDIEAAISSPDNLAENDQIAASSPPFLSPDSFQARRAHSLPGPGLHLLGQFVPEPAPCTPTLLGLVLLHPNLSGHLGPALSRLLARSKFGRSILRPLLRTEVGEVSNRRAWHNTDKLTSEVLELYKAPLRVEGWDTALIETTRLKREFTQGDIASYFGDVRQLPALVVTGQHDRIVPPGKAESLCGDLPRCKLSVLPDCGHLSHEEGPGALLEQLVPFCGEVLSSLASTK